MRTLLISVFPFLVACQLVVLVGCGDESGSGGTGGTQCPVGANTVPFPAQVTGWNPLTGRTEAAADVKVCLTGTDCCVMTDASGDATMDLPVGEEIALTFEKEGFQPDLRAAVIPEEPRTKPYRVALGTVERYQYLHGLVMSPYPMEGTGDALLFNREAAALAVTFELVDAEGKGFYYNEVGDWDADLTATTSYALGPLGGFTEVDPGEVQVDFGGTGGNCIRLTGWPSDKANSVRIPIREGYVSQVEITCLP